MKAKELQEKYPEFWQHVYDNVLRDITYVNKVDKTKRFAIAHNAAFVACAYYDKYCNVKELKG